MNEYCIILHCIRIHLRTVSLISVSFHFVLLIFLNIVADEDHLGDWWCNLFRIVAYWSLAEDEKAHELYSTIGNVPDSLLDDPLCKSLLAAFSAKCEIK